METMKFIRTAALGFGTLLAPLAAQAAPLTGSLDFTGLFQAENGARTSVRLADATAIDFCAGASGPCVTSADAGTGTGVFQLRNLDPGSNLPVAAGDTGTVKDFVFDGFSAPIADFFIIGGLTFDLERVLVTKFTIPAMTRTARPVDYLLISGLGTMRAAGFDDTPGSFTFSGQSDGRNLVGSFAFSGGAAAQPIPAPAGLLLLGAGIVALVLAQRRAG